MKALICGVAGQDGGYLAELLLKNGYEVIGTSRDAMITSFSNLARLHILDHVQTTSMAINDFRSVLNVVQRFKPDEIYNLAGQTSVGLSFEQPVEAMESIAQGTLNMLEVVRFVGQPIRFYNAGSSECFGDTGTHAADESTSFRPRSPYAVAKASAHWLVQNYREAYGLFACTGILFNHESPLRPERFVTQKIVRAAARISQDRSKTLQLGNIEIYRDWGWAPDYVDAMWRMLQQERADDFVIATGHTQSLEYFVECAFGQFGLNWKDHVRVESNLFRPSDLRVSHANPEKAARQLGWTAQTSFEEVVKRMAEDAALFVHGERG